MKYLYLATIALAGTASATITFNLNFIDAAGEIWDSDRENILATAANDWGSLFVNGYTIDVNVTFASAGSSGYLGEWGGSFAGFVGEDVRPWSSSVTQTISFNVDRMDTNDSNYIWWDSSDLSDNSDQPFEAWDAYSIALHEFGHLLGFVDDFYRDDIGNAGEVNLWGDQITSNVFDPSGLNVPLTSDNAHIDDVGAWEDDLMSATLFNNERVGINQNHLDMLTLAYGYDLIAIPEPSAVVSFFGVLTLGVSMTRRRRVG